MHDVRSRSRTVKSPASPSYLARPMRPVYSKFGHQNLAPTSDKQKKPRARKGSGFNKYDMLKKGSGPDYTDVAYREAVSRLRYLLNEPYVPGPHHHTKYIHAPVKADESDDESGVSIVVSDRTRVARLSPYTRPVLPPKLYCQPKSERGGGPYLEPAAPPELVSFVERQEEYIEQLEKESQYCRDELSQLLGKVKDLIAENESLHAQHRSGVLKNVFEDTDASDLSGVYRKDKLCKRLEGPMIVFESRISELEAQLTQGRIDLRKSQDETELYRRKLLDADPSAASVELYRQIETLQREKRDLAESLSKVQVSMSMFKEKEQDASKRVQRTLDVMDKTTFEKQQAEMEVHRLKNELEHQHDKLIGVLSDQTRKVSDERGQAERRYLTHVDQLSAELAAQRDLATKLQLDLDKRSRLEDDLRRDLIAKTAIIEQVKKELNSKIGSLQTELTTALTERDSLEQELNTARMSGERSDRVSRQEAARLQVEVSAFKQRLDRTDAELIHARRENLRLGEQIASQDKEITLYKIQLGEKVDTLNGMKDKDKELTSRLSEVEIKQVESVSGLEGLIDNQGQEIATLKRECETLTRKLEESTALHKEEMATLQNSLDYLTGKLETTFLGNQWQPELAPSHHENFIPDETYPENTVYDQQPQFENENYQNQEYDQAPDDTEQLYVQEIPDQAQLPFAEPGQPEYHVETQDHHSPEHQYEAYNKYGEQYKTQPDNETEHQPYETQPPVYEKEPQTYQPDVTGYETKPQPYETQPHGYETSPQQYETQQPHGYDTTPQPYEIQPTAYETPQSYNTQPTTFETMPELYESQPRGYETAPQQYETQQPHGYETAPQQYETQQPHGYETAPQQYETQPHSYETTPQPYETQQPHGYETTPQPYETLPQRYETDVQPQTSNSFQPPDQPDSAPKPKEPVRNNQRSALQTKVQKTMPAVRLQQKSNQQKPK